MAENDKKGEDFITLGPVLEDGTQPYIRHRADHSIETGVSRIMEEGKPMYGDEKSLVRLTPRDPWSYNVEPLQEKSAATSGPAKVATKAYREGWDSIFGGSKTVGVA